MMVHYSPSVPSCRYLPEFSAASQKGVTGGTQRTMAVAHVLLIHAVFTQASGEPLHHDVCENTCIPTQARDCRLSQPYALVAR